MEIISKKKKKKNWPFSSTLWQTFWWMFYVNVQMFFLVSLNLVKQLENISSHISNILSKDTE